MPVPTPHIAAKAGDIAKTVLMPGDPLRSKFIAETCLENPVLVNNVRGVQGYTGTWKGVPVTVMASGMGIPSIGIYSWELYNFYDVDNIIRVGSAGALADDLNLMDVVAGAGACTDSNFAHQFGLNGTFAPIADYTLLSQAVAAAAANGVALHVGNQRVFALWVGDPQAHHAHGHLHHFVRMRVVHEGARAARFKLIDEGFAGRNVRLV